MILSLFASGMMMAGTAASCAAPADSVAVDLREMFANGQTFSVFLESAERRREQWFEHYEAAEVPEALLERVRAVEGSWRLLVVLEDWCGDSVNTIPYVARLVDLAENLDMRVVRSDVGRPVMDMHRTPDDRAATPTLLLLDADFGEVGCFIERPRPLREWVLDNKDAMDDEALHDHVFSWYGEDAGQTTLEEVVELMERASAGDPRCDAP